MAAVRAVTIFADDALRVGRWWAVHLGASSELGLEPGGFCWFDGDGVEVGFHPADDARNPRGANPVIYWSVADLTRRRAELLAAGCGPHRGPISVGADRSICQLVDPFGNVFGLDGPVTPTPDATAPDAPARRGRRPATGVTLRALRASDAEVLIAESAAETRSDVPRDRPRDKLLEQIAHGPCLEVDGYVEYGIEASGALVGSLQVRAPARAFPPGVCEFGIVVFPSARGRGIGSQAVEEITARLLHEGWKRIQAATAVNNPAMQRVLTLAGYQLEGVMRCYAPGIDTVRDDYQSWAVTAEQ